MKRVIKIKRMLFLLALCIVLLCSCSNKSTGNYQDNRTDTLPPRQTTQGESNNLANDSEQSTRYGYVGPCDIHGNSTQMLIGAFNSANTYVNVYADNSIVYTEIIDEVTGQLEGDRFVGTWQNYDRPVDLYCAIHGDYLVMEYLAADEYVQYLLFEKE